MICASRYTPTDCRSVSCAIIIIGDIAASDIREVARLGLPLAHKPISTEQLRELLAATLA
jgi:hypothetical protein